MTNDDILTDQGGTVLGRSVNDRAILNVGSRADADIINVAADHAAEPETRLPRHLDVTNHACPRRNVCARREAWPDIAKRQDVCAVGAHDLWEKWQLFESGGFRQAEHQIHI